jgi:hypothetical protein
VDRAEAARAEEPAEVPVFGLEEGEAELRPEPRVVGIELDACCAQIEHWRSLLLPRDLPVSTTREDAALFRR